MAPTAASVIDPLELPEPNPPGVPFWAENYVFEVTCPEVNAGFFLHLARQPFDTELWRETAVVDLGGDEVYLWKGFGAGAHPAGPGGGQLRFSCEESFQRWTIELRGAAQRVAREMVAPGARGSLPDGPIVALRLRMTAVADGPVWDLSAGLDSHDMGDAHYNQSMRITDGEVVVGDGPALPLEGVGWRDHTRGPRELSELGSYACVHGGFPGGRRFIVLALDHRDPAKEPLRAAVVSDGGRLTPARIIEVTAIPPDQGVPPDEFVLRLETENGVETIEGERTTSGVVVGVGAPNHFMLGPATDPTARGHLCGTAVRLRWNGEPCHGYSELTAAVGGSLGAP